MIDLIPPFRNTLKRATIEPLIIQQEKLDELKNTLADPRSTECRKNNVMREISGSCHSCGLFPSQVVKYRMHGMIVVERYCDECLARINA
jgi:hypothetical protein